MTRMKSWKTTLALGLWLCGRTALADANNDYKIAAQDVILIDVVGEKELNRECRVSSSGTITFAWLTNVEVKGKTTAEIETLLRELLDRDYLVDPTVMVSVKDYRTREVTVLGPVNRPGSIVLPGEQKLTIVDVIGRAGGLTKLANENKIQFTHAGKTQTFSMEELKKITDPAKVIYVEPGDIIQTIEKLF